MVEEGDRLDCPVGFQSWLQRMQLLGFVPLLWLRPLPLTLCPSLQVGDAIPSVEVFEGEPGNKVNLAELFKGKKGVLFGVPGAFTPGCSKVRLWVFLSLLLSRGLCCSRSV